MFYNMIQTIYTQNNQKKTHYEMFKNSQCKKCKP